MRALRRFTMKAPNPTQLDAAATSQRVGDLVEYRDYDQLDVRHPKMRIAGGEFCDEIGPGHHRQCVQRS
jgi:hypothetical protein